MVAKMRPSLTTDAPQVSSETLYTCGTLGVWMGKSFEGALGCHRKTSFNGFDAHAQLCWACSKAMCAEFQVPPHSSGPCEVAIRSLHRFQGMLTGFASIGRYEAVRMIVLASGAVINTPTEREQKGADHIGKLLKKATETEIGGMPEPEFYSSRLAAGGVG